MQPAPSDLTQRISTNRRDFLRATAGVLASTEFLRRGLARPASQTTARKAVVVTFGGGARDDETFAPEGQKNIPNLLQHLIPRATFFTRVVNRGILGHYVATASLATGVYETFNNFADVAPLNPTVFEYFRRGLKRPARDAWVIAPSNGFARMGESSHRSYGQAYGAGMILPKHLLAAASDKNSDHGRLLQDNYEAPFETAGLSGNEMQLKQLEQTLKIPSRELTARAQTLESPDELSVYIAGRLMDQLAPSLLWITLHDMDVAHSGAFSLYLDGIRRTDRLCLQIWNMIQAHPEYSGKTHMFILPDFGRDSDTNAAGNGFQHHRTGDLLSRTTWLMAMGPGIREGVAVDRLVQSVDLVPTLGALLGFSTPFCQGQALTEVL